MIFTVFTVAGSPTGPRKRIPGMHVGISLDNTQDAMSSILAFDGDLIRPSLGTNERASKPPARPKHHFIFLPIQIYRTELGLLQKKSCF